MVTTATSGADFGWFRALDTPFGPTWWSARHGCFARVLRGLEGGRGAPFGLGVPGPRKLAWASDKSWIACEHVVGPTFAELLARVPARELHESVHQLVLGRALDFRFRFTHDGWAVPRAEQIRLGFDGTVAIEVQVGRGLPPNGWPDSSMRDAYHDARDASVGHFEAHARGVARGLGLSLTHVDRELDAWAALDVPLPGLLADVFPDAQRAWWDARERARALPSLDAPPEGSWMDVVLQAEQKERQRMNARADFARGGARQLLDRLADEDRDFSERDWSDVDPARDAPEAVARLHLMRERPLAQWTWRELAEWKGVRRQRLRALLGTRGLAPEPQSVGWAEVACEERVLKGETDLRRLQLFHGTPEPRIEHVMRRGSIAGWESHVPAEVVQRERGELQARSLFAIEAWCASTFDNATIAEVRDAWRARWLAVDDALGAEGIARCGELKPHFTPVAADALARAAATMEEEARPPPPQQPNRSVTVPATTPVATFRNTVDVVIANPGADVPPRIEVEVALRISSDTFEASTATFLGDVSFGRTSANEVQLSRGGVARMHATLRVSAGVLYVVDRRSANGTFVDGSKVNTPMVVLPASFIYIEAYRIRARLLPPPSV